MDTSVEQGNQDGDSIVTLGEVLQAEEEMIEDANAVLGAGDDKNCTYSEGYMKRQPLYACLTCNPEAKTDPSKRAGICLACCYHCHDGHELVELYTKRNFRCDCGNSKFPNTTCNLIKSKDEINSLNNYNQNFSGLYCTCSKPYPDPDDSVADEMIQCIICEDWFHTRHLDCKLPPMDSYAEMTCKECIKKHDFLLHYDNLCVKFPTSEEPQVDVESVDKGTGMNGIEQSEEVQKEKETEENGVTEDKREPEVQTEDKTENREENKTENSEENKIENTEENKTENTEENKTENSEEKTEKIENEKTDMNSEKETELDNKNLPAEVEDKKEENETVDKNSKEAEVISKEEVPDEVQKEAIKVKEAPEKQEGGGDNAEVPTLNGHPKDCTKPKTKSTDITARFWANVNWRQQLCTCSECLKIYEEHKLTFLIDNGDTVQHYEEKGKVKSLENAKKAEEDSIKFLNSVDRVPLMETLAAFNDLKENLIDYLKKFAENKKVVREEDIREFFSDYESRKKPKMDVPHMCR